MSQIKILLKTDSNYCSQLAGNKIIPAGTYSFWLMHKPRKRTLGAVIYNGESINEKIFESIMLLNQTTFGYSNFDFIIDFINNNKNSIKELIYTFRSNSNIYVVQDHSEVLRYFVNDIDYKVNESKDSKIFWVLNDYLYECVMMYADKITGKIVLSEIDTQRYHDRAERIKASKIFTVDKLIERLKQLKDLEMKRLYLSQLDIMPGTKIIIDLTEQIAETHIEVNIEILESYKSLNFCQTFNHKAIAGHEEVFVKNVGKVVDLDDNGNFIFE